MGGFRYPATPEERRAAALLREKGWNVDEPRCPECKGFGYVTEWREGDWRGGDDYRFRSSSLDYKSCPNGCPPASVYLTAGALA